MLRTSGSLLADAGETQPPPREPYVQGITASSAVICWVNERPGAPSGPSTRLWAVRRRCLRSASSLVISKTLPAGRRLLYQCIDDVL